MFRSLLLLPVFHLLSTAYIPALPSNASIETQESQADTGIPINDTDTSTLSLIASLASLRSLKISYQIAGNGSNGLSEGALVHFSEDLVSRDPSDLTQTPWIAFVACDANATNASMIDDIFTLAQDRGAVGALLYSQWSNACIINADYLNTSNFNRLFDIFTTKRLADSNIVEGQFQKGFGNGSFYNYSAAGLNASYAQINQTIANGSTTQMGYFVAILQAYNATAFPNNTSGGGGPGGQHGGPNGGGGSGSNSGLAMIILYAITGCVSALFCVVILSGAVRAIRHPERYGPRPDDPTMGGGGRSRTAGLGRAILDTFPVIKFGSEESRSVLPVNSNGKGERGGGMEMHTLDKANAAQESPEENYGIDGIAEVEDEDVRPSSSTSRPTSSSAVPNIQQTSDEVDPEAIGHETCPICIVDFSNGDDLRVLPCEGKHRFHQACVDPWLLEMSSSCPLCREDFLTLESMVQGGAPPASQDGHSTIESTSLPQQQQQQERPGLVATTSPTSLPRSRRHTLANPNFSKYLRFAQRRRMRGQEEGE